MRFNCAVSQISLVTEDTINVSPPLLKHPEHTKANITAEAAI